MVKTIDYYGFWNKNRKEERPIRDREKISFSLIKKVVKKGDYLLDVGCGDGLYTCFLKKNFPEINIRGTDFSPSELAEAKKRGLDVKRGNFEESLPYKDKSFNIIYSGEVIEHLFNPDRFLEEINRITKLNGFFVLSTPNLCAWYNRILMLAGVQPLFLEMSTKSKMIGGGFLNRFKKEPQPVGHVRIFTLRALKDLLKMNGFEIMEIKGANYDEGFPNIVLFFDNIMKNFKTLSSHFIILSKKIKDSKEL